MAFDIAGIGNALMDALVVVDSDDILNQLELTKGTMHPVDNDRWEATFKHFNTDDVLFDSGGSCANTIATAGRLGCSAIYSGQVGDDKLGHLYASLMKEATGHHALRFTDEAATGKCLSIISKADAERTMVTDLGAAVGLSDLSDEISSALADTGIAHFTGYTLLPGPGQAVVLDAIRQARDAGAKISIDAADPFVIDLVKDLFWDVLETSADLVFLNEEEAKHLAGVPAEEAVDVIADKANVQTVVVKLGKRGSVVRHGSEKFQIQAELVEAVDTTGAGDAYAGGFLTGMAKGWDIPRCGKLASHVAALTVSQLGATVKDPVALKKAFDASK